jgi:hypothetical protein
MWHRIFALVSGEFLLDRKDNGGSVIFSRSVLTSVLAYAFTIVVRQLFAPGVAPHFSVDEMRGAAYDTLPWFGAIFAGVYASFYARFASQWNYLAGLYNQIKATEAQLLATADPERAALAFAEWKAGFIEDADTLHLSGKALFAPIISAWIEDPLVQYTLRHGSKRGTELLLRLKPPPVKPALN